jgi:hypothetical protein
MKLATGTVVEGKVVVEGLPLAEGSRVTVLAHEPDESFEVTPEMENELLQAIGEADRGETVSAEVVLQGLRGRL